MVATTMEVPTRHGRTAVNVQLFGNAIQSGIVYNYKSLGQ
jgi:hypothetical protein